MQRGLPEGLINSKESVPGAIEELDRVDVEQIIFLWKGMSLLPPRFACINTDYANVQRISQTNTQCLMELVSV